MEREILNLLSAQIELLMFGDLSDPMVQSAMCTLSDEVKVKVNGGR